jgi:hypothetical protein
VKKPATWHDCSLSVNPSYKPCNDSKPGKLQFIVLALEPGALLNYLQDYENFQAACYRSFTTMQILLGVLTKMKFSAPKALLGTAATLCLLAVTGQSAQAGSMYNGWNYSIDSFNDGYSMGVTGSDSDFEFFGMAVRETADRLVFAFNSNLAFDAATPENNGSASRHANDGRINYGDLFLNFTGENFDNANGDLFAIHFDATNDSDVRQLGLYSDVTAVSRTGENSGFRSINHHRNTVGRNNVSYGDLDAYASDFENNSTYFRNGSRALTNIQRGTFVSDLAFLSENELGDMGLDFGNFDATGNYTFGFSVARSDMPTGNFIANLFAECSNDGIALNGETTEDVPEPSILGGLVLAGMLAGGSKLRRRKSDAAA